METLSSSFLQKQNLSSSPFPLIQPKFPTVRINVRCAAQNTSTPNLTLPKTNQKHSSLLANFFNSLEDFICKHMDPPLHPGINPDIILHGNFVPVPELPPTACHVTEGALPPCLHGGAYIRNGPNPQFLTRGPYHLFDGDGMLHCLKISSTATAATFCSRFVRTNKYTAERESGFPVVINYFSAFTGLLSSVARYSVAIGRDVSGQYELRRGSGAANTSVACFGGNLFAMCESDLPYRIRVTPDGDIITLGRHEDYGEPTHQMTAHPKVDPETGETFAFRHSMFHPFLAYFRISPDGTKQPEVKIYSQNQASLVHDFAVTKNYAIFPDSQIVMRPGDMLKGKQMVFVDPTKVPRLGIIPRYAEDEREMWWVEVPGLNVMHVFNAWEEEDGGGATTIVMVAPNLMSVEHVIERQDLTHLSMERIEINVKTKRVTRQPVSVAKLEFGVINPAYVGKKTRYMYPGIVNKGVKMSGVAKIDISLSNTGSCDCMVARRLYGPGCYGGESCFVPREPDNPAAEEDDGYLLNYVFNEDTQESKFIVMDAKSPDLDIVAVVKLPQRVPYGFHGLFVRERDLQKL